MDRLHRINESINYMETHLMEELSIEQISNYVFASKSNFQRVFHMATGVTIGEYIRNRRLSPAGQASLIFLNLPMRNSQEIMRLCTSRKNMTSVPCTTSPEISCSAQSLLTHKAAQNGVIYTVFVEEGNPIKLNLEEEIIMSGLEVNIEYIEQQTIYGLWQKSNDKTISRDIKALSKQYHAVVSVPEGKVLPYFVLSRNYNEQSRNFELFIGSTIDKSGLKSCILSAGEYAKITVKPKLGFLWGASIGEAKQYFYTKWLPKSSFEALNLEYEYHTERSKEKPPTIDIIFAIRRKVIN